jgi:hypothetical protein
MRRCTSRVRVRSRRSGVMPACLPAPPRSQGRCSGSSRLQRCTESTPTTRIARARGCRQDADGDGRRTMAPRKSKRTFVARTQREGAGFLIRRSVGSSSVTTAETDPFLMLDELPVTDYKPGEVRRSSVVQYSSRSRRAHPHVESRRRTVCRRAHAPAPRHGHGHVRQARDLRAQGLDGQLGRAPGRRLPMDDCGERHRARRGHGPSGRHSARLSGVREQCAAKAARALRRRG